MPDPKLQVKIETTATGTGAADAARDIDKLTESHKKAANGAAEANTESSNLGDSLLELGRKTNPAREGVEGLESVLRGGADSFFGLAKAGRAVFEIFEKGSPFGVFITAASLLLGVGLALKEKFFEPAEEGLKKTEEASEKAAEGLNGISRLKLDFDQKKKQCDDLAASFDRLRAQSEAAYQAQQKQADAGLALKISQINLQEKSAILAAGGDKDKEKEIGANAEAARINATDQANQRKNNAEIVNASEKAKTFAAQLESTTIKLHEMQEIESKLATAIGTNRRTADTAGVKSDQQAALDELARLRNESQKSARETAQYNQSVELRRNANTSLNPFANVGYDIPANFSESNRQDANASRDLRLRELERNAPDYQAQINAGKATYTDQASKLADEAKKATEEAAKHPSPESTNLAANAREKAADAAALVADPKKYEEAHESVKKLADDVIKLGLNAKASADDLAVAQIRGEAQKTQSKADLTGVAIDVSASNRDRSSRSDKITSENAVHQSNISAIDDQLNRTFSTTDKGKTLQAQRDAEVAKIQADTTPGQIRVPGLDSAIKGDANRTPVGYQTFAPSSPSDGASHAASSLQSASDSLSKAAAPDEFIQSAAILAASISGFAGSTSTAISSVAAQLKQVADQLAAQKQVTDNLASQIANQRQ